jgi:hypothetical protein
MFASTVKCDTLTEWSTVDTVASLPAGLWDCTIGRSNVGMGEKLIKLYEKHLRDVDHVYFVAFNKKKVVGFALFTIYHKDIIEHLPVHLADSIGIFRKIYPNLLCWIEAMSGISDADGQHWWYDNNFWSWDDFFSGLYRQIILYKHKVKSIVFRCYRDEELTEKIRLFYKKHSFCMVEEMPGTRILFKKKYQTAEDYLDDLKKKDRYTIRKALKKSRVNGLQFEEISNKTDIWDQIYPLYLKTNENSMDLMSEPLPKEFFVSLATEQSLCPCIQVIKNSKGEIISFALSIEDEKILHPFVIGMDYSVNKKLFLIYTTYWLFILRAISKGHIEIDMGGTTEFVKQRFGAQIKSSKIFLRLRNPMLNYLLRPLIKKYY